MSDSTLFLFCGFFSKIGEMKAQHSIKNSAKRIDCTNWDAKQRARNGCHALTYKP